MQALVRKLGNSSGVIIPKAMLTELGLNAGDNVELALDDGRIVLTPVRHQPRQGWAQAARELAEAGDDGLVWPEFGNCDDDALSW